MQWEMCKLHIWKIFAFSNFSVTKVLQSYSCKFELPKYTMMWSLLSEWQAKNLSIFLAYYVIFKLATSVFQRCFDWMDTFVLKVQKMEVLKVKEKGGEGDDIWQKLAVLLIEIKLLCKDWWSIHQIKFNAIFSNIFDQNKYIWIQDNFSYSIKEEYIGWNRMRSGRRRKLGKSLLFGKFWTFYLSSLWIPKGV